MNRTSTDQSTSVPVIDPFRYLKAFPAILTIIGLLSGPRTSSAAEKKTMETNGTIRVGQAAPPLAAVDINGQEFSLESLKGRPVFIDFGSVICEACADMVLEMNRLEKKYGGTDLKVVMIADGAVPLEMTKAFFSRLKATFTVVRDEEWSFFIDYGVTIVPFKVLVDRDGMIRKMHLGYAPRVEKRMDFDEVLAR